MKNPFLDYGKIVTGSRFVGRNKEISIIRNRVLNDSFGNIAIQGIPRIGKSSLAWNALLLEKDKLEKEKKIFAIRINVGNILESNDFFSKLAKELYKRIKKNQTLGLDNFLDIYGKFIKSENASEKLDLLEEYFEVLRDAEYRVIYILDEFDAVRNYLGVGEFQFLRELTYNPNTEICLVTLSRRSIKEIEPHGGTVSNFYQTFTDLYLGMYSEDDIGQYWKKFFSKELKLSTDDKNEITNFSGHHPYLLDLFNFHLFNNSEDEIKRKILNTKRSIKLTILNNYHSILELLKEEKLDAPLLQTIIGPVIDITREDVEKLEKYDLIKVSSEKIIETEEKEIKGFDAFSPDFEQYLRMIHRDVPIWDLWSETEIKLRGIVHLWLLERYGESWARKFRKIQKKEAYISKLEEMQAREKKSFPTTYSQNLLDFTYPADLFNYFMSVEWKWFEKIFKGQKNNWKIKFDLLAKIRNPLAHNKENLLKDFERDNTTGVCKEIIERIDDWDKVRLKSTSP